MGYIYKITNLINNKVYIGQTRMSLARRFWYHKRDSKNKKFTLYYAMRKYGIENFKMEAIEECDNSLLNDREVYWVAYYKAHNKNFGYNETNGGMFNERKRKEIDCYDLDGNFIRSYESMSEASREIGVRESHISNCCLGKINQVKGYIFAYKGKQPKSLKGIKGIHRKVYQYDLDGNFVAEYNSARHAGQILNLSKCGILQCLHKNATQSGGFQWSYEKKENIGKYEKPKFEKPHLRKEVYIYDLNGNFIEKLESIMAVGKKYGIPCCAISACCRNDPSYKTSNGYQFSYKLEKKQPVKPRTSKVKINQYDMNNQLIKTYDSLREIERNGFNKFKIVRRLKHKAKVFFEGYYFEYALGGAM